MRNLAKRIERATRDYFLTHEENNRNHAPQSWNDREKLWNRIQELKTELPVKSEEPHGGNNYHEARSKAVTEFIHAMLEEFCILTIELPDLPDFEEDLETDLERVEADIERLSDRVSKVEEDFENHNEVQLKEDLEQVEEDLGQAKEDLRRCKRCKKVVLDLPEESLD